MIDYYKYAIIILYSRLVNEMKDDDIFYLFNRSHIGIRTRITYYQNVVPTAPLRRFERIQLIDLMFLFYEFRQYAMRTSLELGGG
jgi:hypothetical protein